MKKIYLLHKSFLILFFFTFFTCCGSIGKAVELSQIRFGRQSDDCIRVVAHIDQKTNCRIFTLQNPHRIVIDFENTTLKPSLTENIPDPLLFVEAVRVGNPLDGQTRLVLETNTPVDFKEGFFLTPVQNGDSWRYVVDITRTGSVSSTEKPVLLPISPKSSVPYKTKMQKPLIVLDPGHCGADPGAISYSGKYEKNLTLQMAKEFKKEI